MAKYIVMTDDRKEWKIVEATSARRAAEHGAERMYDDKLLTEWAGGTKTFHVKRLPEKGIGQEWTFELILSNPHALIQVLGEIKQAG